jgi:hypothetical protein
MTSYLLVIIISLHPYSAVTHWHHTRAACIADARAHHMHARDCLHAQGPIPPPYLGLGAE